MNGILIILLFFALFFGAWEMFKFILNNIAGILFGLALVVIFVSVFG